MKNQEIAVGLLSYGIYLPEGRQTAEEIAAESGLAANVVREDLGISEKCSPSCEDQPVPMALRASLKAIERAPGLEPDDIDVVLWTGEEYKDYVAQTAGIRLQEEVGARNAWAFDLVGQGVTSLMGLRIARDLMIGDPYVSTVLLAGGTRNLDLVDPVNPHTRWMLAASASGAAMILRRGHSTNRLLDVTTIVDPDMADEVYVPGGGSVHPYSPENLGSEIMYFQVTHPELVERYLRDELAYRVVQVIQRTMLHSGFAGQAPDYLALRHLRPRDRSQVLGSFDLRPDQSDDLTDMGHHGPNDVVISLKKGVEAGFIEKGDKVVLASAGIGFTYSAALIQWG
jgi:3-oxoacyl-[acyl-carrier-protein] synthase-3